MPDPTSILNMPLPRRLLLASLALLAPAAASRAAPAASGPAETAERILVFGDSQAQGLAGGLLRLYRADKLHRVIDKTKISTGLIPRANYDWPVQAANLARTEKVEVAIVMFGANDRPAIRVHGQISQDLQDNFIQTYGDRVAGIAQAFKTANIPLIWVGHPMVRDAVFNEDMEMLDDIFADRVPNEGATYLSLWDVFKGEDGKFNAYGKGVDGQTTKLRADDGVHMTPAGYDVIAALLAPMIAKYRPSALPT